MASVLDNRESSNDGEKVAAIFFFISFLFMKLIHFPLHQTFS